MISFRKSPRTFFTLGTPSMPSQPKQKPESTMADVTVAEALLGLYGSVAALPKLAPVKGVVSQSGCCLTPMGGEHADGDDDGSGSGSGSDCHLSDSGSECSLPPQVPPASQRFLVWHGCVPATAPTTVPITPAAAAPPSPITPAAAAPPSPITPAAAAPPSPITPAAAAPPTPTPGDSSDAPDSSLFPWPAAAKALYVRGHR